MHYFITYNLEGNDRDGPLINIHSRIPPQIFEKKNQNGPDGAHRGPGDTDSWKNLEAENLVSDSLKETLPLDE